MKKWLILGGLLLASELYSQTPSSRDPGVTGSIDEQILSPVTLGKKKKTANGNWWAAQRTFAKRQKKGSGYLRAFERDLEEEQITYHRRMIYQIKQARKLERRNRNRKRSNPNFCYPAGKLGLKRKKF